MKPPELVTATQAELDQILALTKPTLPAKQYQLLVGVLGTFSRRESEDAKKQVRPEAGKLRLTFCGTRLVVTTGTE